MMCYTVSAFKTYKASLIFLLRVMSEREDVALKCVTRNTSTVQTAVLDTFLRRRVKTPSFDSLSAKLLSKSQESFGGKVCLGAKDSDGFWSKSSGGKAELPEVVVVLCLTAGLIFCIAIITIALTGHPFMHLKLYTFWCCHVFTFCICCQIVCWLFFSAGLHKNSRMDSYVMYVEDGSQPSIGCTNIWFGSA